MRHQRSFEICRGSTGGPTCGHDKALLIRRVVSSPRLPVVAALEQRLSISGILRQVGHPPRPACRLFSLAEGVAHAGTIALDLSHVRDTTHAGPSFRGQPAEVVT